MKVLHVLESSLPDMAGYSIRAKYILENQKRIGIEPVGITSPFFPGKIKNREPEFLDGIKYYRTNFIKSPGQGEKKLASYLVRALMMRDYQRAIQKTVERERPDIIHAHSSYLNGIAAGYASRMTGIPFIYEVRTLWGESAVANTELKQNSWKHKAIWKLELRVMRKAQRVVAISSGIMEELVVKGVPAEKIDIIPNGVDTDLFTPRRPDLELLKKYGLEGNFVIGYIGSIRKIEGLSLLIDAYAKGSFSKKGCHLIIVGDGFEREILERKCMEEGLQQGVIFTGNVPHNEVLKYYSLINLFVFPRIDALVNQRVTPLKPLEVMSIARVCLGSDVGGLKELIVEGKNGFLFQRGKVNSLINKINDSLELKQDLDQLGRMAREWVINNRDWKKLIIGYQNIYEKARVA